MPSNIPSQQTPLIDAQTNRITTTWFRFLFGLGPLLVGSVVATLDFPNTAAQTSSDLTVTVTGAKDGDAVRVCVPNGCMLANSCYTGWVSTNDTVTVRLNNYSAAAQDPPSGDFRVVVERY